jgi:hypothetical protein
MNFTALLSSSLFVFAALTACSSGTSGTTTTPGGSQAAFGGINVYATCKNVDYQKIKAGASLSSCDACQVDKCSAEINASLGLDPDKFSGVCEKFNTCACDCASNKDTACTSKCLPDAKVCQDSLKTLKECEKTKCSSECAKDGGP